MKLLYCVTFILLSSFAFAQPGGLDKTYNADFGMGYSDPEAISNTIYAAGRQSDGSTVVTGYFDTGDFQPITQVVRYKTDGTVDPAFKPYVLDSSPISMIIQPDDKILIVGIFDGGIIRLNADGTVDQQFKTNIGTASTDADNESAGIWALTLLDGGKIMIGGAFKKFNGSTRIGIARLKADGTLDNTFSPGDGVDGLVNAIAVQSTGKMVIAGPFVKYNGNDRDGIARINPDGSIDASFNPDGFDEFSPTVARLLVLPDDKLIMGGSFTNYDGQGRIVKTDADGNRDNTFPNYCNSFVFDIAFYNDDQIIVGGDFTAPGKRVVVLNIADGLPDDDFKPYSGANSAVRSVIPLADGEVFIAGGFSKVNGTTRSSVAQLHADGSLVGGRGADAVVNAIANVGDGSIVIGGDFTGFRGVGRNRVARVTSAGLLNTALDPAEGADGAVMAIAKDANGKYIIAGNFTHYRNTARARIARINLDGTLDATFDPGAGANAIIRSVVIQGDGAILIAGDFTSYDGTERDHIARIETDGDLDATFNPGTGTDGTIQSIDLQSSGKIIAVGSFFHYNGDERQFIARINTNGSHDNTFDPGTGADATVYAMKVDGDDNIVIGGGFTTINDISRKGIARLSPDGDVDEDFDTGNDYTTVRTITIKNDGRIFLGGDFDNKIAMLSSAGVPDEKYYPFIAPDNTVLTSVEDANGLIIVGGLFTLYDGIGADRLARLPNSGKRDQRITFDQTFPAVYVNSDPFELTATSTSGLPITYVTSTDTIISINGNMAATTGAGTATITATQPGNEEFNPAPGVARDITAGMDFQEVFFEGPSELQGPVGYVFDLRVYNAYADSGLPVTFRSTDETVAKIGEDKLSLIIVSGGSIDLFAEQVGSDDYHPAGTGKFVNIIIGDPVSGLGDEAHGFLAYPNPTDGPLTIQLPSSHNGSAEATIMNTLGVSLARQAGEDLKFDISSLPKGIYLLKVKSGNQNTVKRIYKK